MGIDIAPIPPHILGEPGCSCLTVADAGWDYRLSIDGLIKSNVTCGKCGEQHLKRFSSCLTCEPHIDLCPFCASKHRKESGHSLLRAGRRALEPCPLQEERGDVGLAKDTLEGADALMRLGEVLASMTGHDAACTAFVKALQVQERLLGSDDARVAVTCMRVAVARHRAQDFERAAHMARRSIGVLQAGSTGGHCDPPSAAHMAFADKLEWELRARSKSRSEARVEVGERGPEGCGLRLSFLKELCDAVACTYFQGEGDFTVAQFARAVVLPSTRASGCRYVDLMPREKVVDAHVAVMYDAGVSFPKLVASLLAALGPDAPEDPKGRRKHRESDPAVWLDLLALNQVTGAAGTGSKGVEWASMACEAARAVGQVAVFSGGEVFACGQGELPKRLVRRALERQVMRGPEAVSGLEGAVPCPRQVLSSPETLAPWLMDRGVPESVMSQWGLPDTGTKSIARLTQEAAAGESALVFGTDGVATRVSSAVHVRILGAGGKTELMKSHQSFPDGSTKPRHCLLSVKLAPEESVEDGIARGVTRELLSPLGRTGGVTLVEGSLQDVVSSKTTSDSYPGLRCKYVVFTATAEMDGLGVPSKSFTTDVCDADGKVIFVNHWEWQPHLEVPDSGIQGLRRADFTGLWKRLLSSNVKGTRGWAFEEIKAWAWQEGSASARGPPRVVWVRGGPASGKSVLIAEALRKFLPADLFAGWHFCRSEEAARCSAMGILTCLASCMCGRLSGYQAVLDVDAITPALEANDVKELWEVLVHRPLAELDIKDPRRPAAVLAIDGLDEIDDNDRSVVLGLIASGAPKLPGWARLLISSRVDADSAASIMATRPMVIDLDSPKGQNDLCAVGRNLLGKIVKSPLPAEDLECAASEAMPGEEWAGQLRPMLSRMRSSATYYTEAMAAVSDDPAMTALLDVPEIRPSADFIRQRRAGGEIMQTLDDLYIGAQFAQEALLFLLANDWEAPESNILRRPAAGGAKPWATGAWDPAVKPRKRAHEKADSEYGGDISRLKDVARVCVAYTDCASLLEGLEAIRAMPPEQCTIVELKNRFAKPTLMGHVGMILVVRVPAREGWYFFGEVVLTLDVALKAAEEAEDQRMALRTSLSSIARGAEQHEEAESWLAAVMSQSAEDVALELLLRRAKGSMLYIGLCERRLLRRGKGPKSGGRVPLSHLANDHLPKDLDAFFSENLAKAFPKGPEGDRWLKATQLLEVLTASREAVKSSMAQRLLGWTDEVMARSTDDISYLFQLQHDGKFQALHRTAVEFITRPPVADPPAPSLRGPSVASTTPGGFAGSFFGGATPGSARQSFRSSFRIEGFEGFDDSIVNSGEGDEPPPVDWHVEPREGHRRLGLALQECLNTGGLSREWPQEALWWWGGRAVPYLAQHGILHLCRAGDVPDAVDIYSRRLDLLEYRAREGFLPSVAIDLEEIRFAADDGKVDMGRPVTPRTPRTPGRPYTPREPPPRMVFLPGTYIAGYDISPAEEARALAAKVARELAFGAPAGSAFLAAGEEPEGSHMRAVFDEWATGPRGSINPMTPRASHAPGLSTSSSITSAGG